MPYEFTKQLVLSTKTEEKL